MTPVAEAMRRQTWRSLFGRRTEPAAGKTYVRLLRQAAVSGNAEARFALGLELAEGLADSSGKELIAQDERAAFVLFHDLAQKGHTDAMLNVSHSFEVGCGVRKNLDQAFSWTEKAAKRGNVTAMTSLGMFHQDRGAYLQARRWFTRAASLGSSDARVELARMQLSGVGCARDPREAIRNLSKVIKKDDVSEVIRDHVAVMLAALSTDRSNAQKIRDQASKLLHKLSSKSNTLSELLLRELDL